MSNNNDSNGKSFFEDGLSIDETKISMLMITYFICFVVTLIFFVKTSDGDGLKTLFFANIGAVTSVNVTSSISKAFNKSSDKDDTSPKG